jgi:DNA-binding IclR family transcriptional regulator
MKSLLRIISILSAFSPNQPELTVADIAYKVNIPESTVYRILSGLTRADLLEKKPGKRTYAIGRRFYILGSLYLSTTDLFKAAEPVVKTISDITGEVTNISILGDNGYVTMLIREESKYPLRHVVHVGSTSPAYAHASGKALLSELTNEEIDRFYPEEKLKKITIKTVATRTELKHELEQIRKTGVAFNSEQAFDGVEAVASVVRDNQDKSMAALAISAPIIRMDEVKRRKFASMVRIGAGLISYRLGYQDDTQPVHEIDELHDWWQKNERDEAFSRDVLINMRV